MVLDGVDRRQGKMCIRDSTLKEKKSITFPYYFKTVNIFYDVVLNCSTEPDTVDVFCMDSTELHNAQQMLSATNHKLSMALEVANIVPWKWNLKDHTILCDLNRPIVMAAMPGSISEDQLSVSDEQYFAKIIKEDRLFSIPGMYQVIFSFQDRLKQPVIALIVLSLIHI